MTAPTCLGRVASINGNVITLVDAVASGFRVGQRIRGGDSAGSATVTEVDRNSATVTVDSVDDAKVVLGGYLFEAPLASEDRRVDAPIREAILDSLLVAVRRHDNESIRALADALRAVEGR